MNDLNVKMREVIGHLKKPKLIKIPEDQNLWINKFTEFYNSMNEDSFFSYRITACINGDYENINDVYDGQSLLSYICIATGDYESIIQDALHHLFELLVDAEYYEYYELANNLSIIIKHLTIYNENI